MVESVKRDLVGVEEGWGRSRSEPFAMQLCVPIDVFVLRHCGSFSTRAVISHINV